MSRICLYCGREARKIGKGEHIIPQALGGAGTIKNVCQECNNEVLSTLDKELCSRSPVSIIASREIDAHIWQVWDVDHASKNLLLEARPKWNNRTLNSLILYPQLVFDKSKSYIQGDREEIEVFGNEDFDRVIIKSILNAFHHYDAGERSWLHLEHIELNDDLSSNYRYPPRIFSRHPIDEIAKQIIRRKKVSYILRYATDEDRHFALNSLDRWNPAIRRDNIDVGRGSYEPWVRFFYDPTKILRGFYKIAMNVLSAYCANTPVNNQSFSDAINVILGSTPVTSWHFEGSGFVNPHHIKAIACPNNGHSFRVFHMDGQWHVISSFFGGQVGSFVGFEGPNDEKWCTANIVAPLKSRDWSVRYSKILAAA